MNSSKDKSWPLEDKVAVVTGGGSGIGEATAMRLAHDGCQVAVFDIDEARARSVARACDGLAMVVDVSDSESFARALQDIDSQLGRLDILVNNAGINGRENMQRVSPRIAQQMQEVARTGKPASTPLDSTVDMTDAEWQQMISVNLSSVFYGTRAALRIMQPKRTGSIVNIASVCGMAGCAGFPHYSAAKAGVLGFTRAVAKEVAHIGIKVNAVAPGFIDTPLQKETGEEFLTALRLQIPTGELGSPAEVAAAVAFLCSADGAYMIGTTLSPNGGFLTI